MSRASRAFSAVGAWIRAAPSRALHTARRVPSAFRHRARARPFDAVAQVLALVVTLVTVAWPLVVCHYPAMTDLPMHAAQTGAFRHWFDPAYHFQDQFELQPLAVPYDSSYVLGAIFMLVMSAASAVKLATAIMLLFLPLGLATLAWGMRRPPMQGLLGLPLVWGALTQWGFVNFVSALGQFALVLGLALRTVDRPTRRIQFLLGAACVLVFFTHIFRYPFAIAGVGFAAVVAWPATRRIRPVIVPVLPSLVLFALFYFRRSAALGGSLKGLPFEWSRTKNFLSIVFHGFNDPAEVFWVAALLTTLAGVQIVTIGAWLGPRLWRLRKAPVGARVRAWLRRGRGRALERDSASTDNPSPWLGGPARERTWQARADAHFSWLVSIVPLGCAAAFFLLFLKLPMAIGVWWYVYPREAVAAFFLLLGFVPGFPRRGFFKLVTVSAYCAATLGYASVTARGYAEFGRATEDFDRIQAELPEAPKLAYLVFDHEGFKSNTTPFIHLPAYIQAEKGGWLSFHFAIWGASPIRYRTDDHAIVPPAVPHRWEWTPEQFNVRTHGAFFNWFLVRSGACPDVLFRDDPTIVSVAHEGTWWLYKRDLSAVRR